MLILSPIPKQFLDESGVPYTDGTVSIYLHGDTEFAEVYADAEGTALIENPCILDSHGMWQGFVDSDKPLDYIVKDSEGNVITRFCNISLPTGDDIPGVKVISSDGSINVDETLENGERTFDITVNDDMFKPSCAKFSHEAVNGGGQVSFDSFELEGDPDRDIYLTDGVITFAEGVYHISANLVIGNDECHNEYFGITANFGDCSTAKVWDRSFVHEESVEIGLDIVADVDGYTVVPTIAELPDDMHCSISRLYIHKVSGAGVGGSMASVEHDGTLVGDGTHNDPLGVKDWSEIRTTLENTANELLDHEVSPSAHQDIRDELERKEDKDNKVTSWGSTLSDEKYPSEKLVKDTIDNLPPGTAVKGDAESEYRTGNVNLTPANLGAKPLQTAVSDPSASGTGLDFIDTISQDASGVISPHKKTVQDGTTAQKGVVKLSNAIDSTSVTEAATPKAVKDAYDELNNKIVARAVFLSQAEWAVQSQLQGDPAKVYYVENGTGEDAYTVYVWRESTSTYEEVDESSIDLDGYWHDGPTTTGSGNVVTNITLGNDGVPQVTKGLTALTQHQSVTDNDPTLAWGTRSKVGTIGSTELHVTMPGNPASGKLDSTGDASNTTSTFSKATGDTSTMTSGGKLFAIFTAISSFFASLKALAFKDKASYNDLSSGVQSSLDKADSALQSHQSVTDNSPTLAWEATSKVGSVGSTDLRVTMPSNPAQNLPASVITSGTFGTDRIADDAITAAKVKDNETLLVNIRGSASQLSHVTSQNEASTWRQIAKLESSDANRVIAQGFVVAVRERVNSSGYYTGTYIVSCTSKGSDCRILQGTRLANGYDMEFVVAVESDSITLYAKSGPYSPYHVTALFGNPVIAIGSALGSKPTGTDVSKTFLLDTSGQVGDSTTPVYVDSNGQVRPCKQGATLKSNTATLYIAGYTDNNIPYYHVKDIKNGCVNHVAFSGITNSTCDITFEAPTLSTGEEYDYIISLEGYTNNNGYSTGPSVENCKQVLYYDSVNNLWRGEALFLQATDWRQICVVRGNTCEWKRIALS